MAKALSPASDVAPSFQMLFFLLSSFHCAHTANGQQHRWCHRHVYRLFVRQPHNNSLSQRNNVLSKRRKGWSEEGGRRCNIDDCEKQTRCWSPSYLEKRFGFLILNLLTVLTKSLIWFPDFRGMARVSAFLWFWVWMQSQLEFRSEVFFF